MPQIELRTRMRPAGRNGPELILEILLTPRGSGNRNLARRLAAAAKNHPRLGPHVIRVRSGYSKVWVSLRPSLDLASVLATWRQEQTADVEGQLPLFGGSPAA